ncbi:MAG: cation transporter [Ignavibacteria bacterium CG1_02_37_35]|nr:efflux RND transporter permease subunit [Ignavibacteria bacterium]OIO17531.1 MAG: cation transporter [Ignavibacteria bacterium CG1_02_37_35]PJC59584.1 MAG: CusA/CzcA family heavy metal efflux RND transporter [Ignavibacteria bacterium CG_4_9_14_0_2_um_filter_37_13]
MLEKIIEFSIRNKFMVILATLFLIGVGIYSMLSTPVDAIPDLSDVQVIIYTQYPGQSPRIVEDQVTYPLTTAMVSVPGSKVVRGYSFFGYSLVYVIFEDGTDIYWARSRVLEYLNYAQQRLPNNIVPTLGPDATGVGWVYEYKLTSDKRSLQELRSIQDWYLKYALSAVDGVSEVASIGGYVKQYQVTVDPAKLLAYNFPLPMIEMAIKKSNNDVGGEVIEMGEMEFMVRGLGYIKSVEDIQNIPLMVNKMTNAPVYLKDVADVTIGPLMRRGLAESNGEGEVVGGIIVMRYGQNALKVIENVKQKIEELKAGIPSDVKIEAVYDRAGLIERAIDTLKEKLIEEILFVALICILFLLHARSAFVAIITLPTAILMAFIVMRWQGINANIMSLSGIAIAIGAMVDAAIIMIENAHKHIEHDMLKPPEQRRERWQLIIDASKEVGPSLFYSLLVITVSFIPVFTLEAQEGRLFRPLAFTKTYSMAAAAILSVTLVPILMGYWIKGRILPEEKNPINRFLIKIYHPVVDFVIKHNKAVLVTALIILGLTIIPYNKIGSEFMPPLYEGDLLYMPTTMPGMSITKAREILQQMDKIIKTFPEVHHVFGKIGRAETATDPAGLDMIETTIMLKPEDEWRPGMTVQKLIDEMDRAIQFPGVTNAWTMPIKTRTDMLSTGIKTPVGIKISGPDLLTLQDIGKEIESVMRTVPGTLTAFAERAVGGNYLDIEINRKEAARYGLTIEDVEMVIQSAMGGMSVTNTVEGLERYTVNLRYSRELRDNIEAMKKVLVPTPTGEQVPMGQLATITPRKGPMVVRSEDTRPNAWVYVDIKNIDVGTYVKNAQKTVSEKIKLPAGYNISWSGEYEYMLRSQERMLYVIPMTLFIIFVIIYLNTKSLVKVGIVFLAVPFSLVGTFWLLYLLGYNISIAVWVGIIALAGLDAETGVVMLLYLDVALKEWKEKGLLTGLKGLKDAIHHGAVKRVRPKIMTASVILAGLAPIMWSHGTGADIMKRIAAPMLGGVVTSVLMELAVYPVIYYLWRSWEMKKQARLEGKLLEN